MNQFDWFSNTASSYNDYLSYMNIASTLAQMEPIEPTDPWSWNIVAGQAVMDSLTAIRYASPTPELRPFETRVRDLFDALRREDVYNITAQGAPNRPNPVHELFQYGCSQHFMVGVFLACPDLFAKDCEMTDKEIEKYQSIRVDIISRLQRHPGMAKDANTPYGKLLNSLRKAAGVRYAGDDEENEE